ncbi:MAG: hypothetical protein L0G27_06265, partial [Paracoccus sp. (in: a-proteobacteria)]|nr:hypothetical protein [Paracoccus sp. (in: a-proteobacteria)]
PREQNYLISTMTPDLEATGLFHTVNRKQPPDMVVELHALIAEAGHHSGEQLARIRASGHL